MRVLIRLTPPILQLYAQVTHCAIDFRVGEQKLHGAKVAPFCGKSPRLWFDASSVYRIRWVPDQWLSPSPAQVDHIDVLRYADCHESGSKVKIWFADGVVLWQ
jgi:hypothetical protein